MTFNLRWMLLGTTPLVIGLLLMIIGLSTICFTLLLHGTAVRYGRSLAEP